MEKAVLLFDGYGSCGKTTATRNVKNLLEKNGYKVTNSKKTGEPWWDKLFLLEGKNSKNKSVKIIINTASDNAEVLAAFENFLKENQYDIIISAIRDSKSVRKDMHKIIDSYTTVKDFKIEIPLVKINSNRAQFNTILKHYEDSVKNLAKHILKSYPFNLTLE